MPKDGGSRSTISVLVCLSEESAFRSRCRRSAFPTSHLAPSLGREGGKLLPPPLSPSLFGAFFTQGKKEGCRWEWLAAAGHRGGRVEAACASVSLREGASSAQ